MDGPLPKVGWFQGCGIGLEEQGDSFMWNTVMKPNGASSPERGFPVDQLPAREICSTFNTAQYGFSATLLPPDEPPNPIVHVMLLNGEFSALFAALYESWPYVDVYIIIESTGKRRNPLWPRRSNILGADIFEHYLSRIEYIHHEDGVDPEMLDVARLESALPVLRTMGTTRRPSAKLSVSQASVLLVGRADEVPSRAYGVHSM